MIPAIEHQTTNKENKALGNEKNTIHMKSAGWATKLNGLENWSLLMGALGQGERPTESACIKHFLLQRQRQRQQQRQQQQQQEQRQQTGQQQRQKQHGMCAMQNHANFASHCCCRRN